MTKVLAIIPARAGSKGLKNKNIKLLNGKPLIAYTIMEAKKSKLISNIVVSTDSDEIASISNESIFLFKTSLITFAKSALNLSDVKSFLFPNPIKLSLFNFALP